MILVNDTLPVGEVTKKTRRRSRRGGRKAEKRRSKNRSTTTAAAVIDRVSSPVKCAVHAFLLRYQSALRRVPSHPPPKVRAGPPSKRVKRVSWCELNFIALVNLYVVTFFCLIEAKHAKQRRFILQFRININNRNECTIF